VDVLSVEMEMNEYDDVIERLKRRLGDSRNGVPGVDQEGPRQAAVALVLRENRGAAEMLIIKRATRRGDHWSGNLALPGGRWETRDENLLETAVRETREEVGIDLDKGGTILGSLGSITTQNPMIPRVQVVPFVAVAPRGFHVAEDLQPSESMVLSNEVATAFWVPLRFLVERGASETFSLTYKGEKREWPAYPTEHGVIWGMTEGMLTEFFERLGGKTDVR
jgi:8-oxo-dGTP pyrophosphatase MutT (NUDIX family)